ncbi:HAMP domain-containing histidine kinase [Intestinibacillus massiliensis]|uniref:sensor histidine kinase n=1 Tax=Intestinibacillus massiliensis TaxID=1871029 RepID=UPI000B351763|nr:ATP-binding protein [Intestinibacillus massiliensis]MCB6366083.1 HAMP domain-containing histidine kinase [Intestinibacillus massiliensis]
MKHSIKIKFFAIIVAIAFAFISILTVLNVFFYDDYYLYERRGALAEIYRSVNAQYDGTVDEVSAQLEQLENSTGVRLSILSPTGGIKYDSIFREQPPRTSWIGGSYAIRLYDFPLEGATLTEQNLNEMRAQGYTYVTVPDSRQARAETADATVLPDGQGPRGGFLCLAGMLLDGKEMLIARVPMSYMEQNSSFNLTFLLITGVLTLCVCIVLAYFISRQFSRPLIRMEEIATAMAGLDFSKKYKGKADDEIGRLGESINRLSEHLEQAITALQNTNESLAREVDEKERIDAMRREFIVNVSHELKTPIALIQGYAEGLRVGVTDNEADREFYCDTIVDEAQRMNHLVMQLLSLSKLELGREVPEPTDVDLYALCRSMAEKTAVLRGERGQSIEYGQTHEAMYADYGMMEQVVTNFVSNAIRYTPQGGKIVLSAQREPDGAVTLAVMNEGEHIAEGDLAMIFEKFYRTDKARSRESGGTGIGLSIVRAIADAHGGACGAENVEGGVRFWFRVPDEAHSPLCG